MRKLIKLIQITKSYPEFESKVLSYLRWYEVPTTWTKKDLLNIYQTYKGKKL